MLQVEAKDKRLSSNSNQWHNFSINFLGFNIPNSLSSLIGAWIGRSSDNIFRSILIYGDTSSPVVSIKYINLLTCFVAFGSFLQCVRCFVHANFFISMPDTDIPVNYVQKAVIRGSLFWSVGLRAIYFATILLLWIFGPIPMFAASVILVTVLHILDTNSTSMHQFEPAKTHNLVRKIGEEITAVARVIERQIIE